MKARLFISIISLLISFNSYSAEGDNNAISTPADKPYILEDTSIVDFFFIDKDGERELVAFRVIYDPTLKTLSFLKCPTNDFEACTFYKERVSISFEELKKKRKHYSWKIHKDLNINGYLPTISYWIGYLYPIFARTWGLRSHRLRAYKALAFLTMVDAAIGFVIWHGWIPNYGTVNRLFTSIHHFVVFSAFTFLGYQIGGSMGMSGQTLNKGLLGTSKYIARSLPFNTYLASDAEGISAQIYVTTIALLDEWLHDGASYPIRRSIQLPYTLDWFSEFVQMLPQHVDQN